MNISRERKFFTKVLIFYWVGIFFATHIPVPNWTRKMGVSDKTMHFAAYFVLTLLLWLSTSFEKKADWKKIRPWLFMGIIAVYGVFDEISQYFIEGRSADPYDLLNNLLGAASAMILVTILAGHHTAMIPFVICPIFLPALVRSKLIAQGSIIENAVYAIIFVIITIVWAQYLSSVYKLNLKQLKHVLIFFAGPAANIAIIKIYAAISNKPLAKTAILSALVSIVLTLIICRIFAKNKSII
jgi:VanZ family protein